MKVTELIKQVRQAKPKLLNGIPEDKAEALVTNVVKHINDTLAGTEEGVVKYASLGRFRVRKVEREVEGEKIMRTQISSAGPSRVRAKANARATKPRVLKPRPEGRTGKALWTSRWMCPGHVYPAVGARIHQEARLVAHFVAMTSQHAERFTPARDQIYVRRA